MPWFKIDDSAHSHPKWVKAGNAALGLWMRCGSYSAQHLTEGVIPGEIARLYGTAPQAAKLVKVGLWHQAGHDCPRCPQPGSGDYVMHDFFEGGRNTTRTQAHAAREAAAERQRKRRSKQNAELFDEESSAKTNRNEDESKTNRPRNEPHFEDSAAGQDRLSQRDATDGVTPPLAKPSQTGTPIGSTGEKASELTGAAARTPQPPPDFALPLVRAMQNLGIIGITWNLGGQWALVSELMRTRGVDAMAQHAAATVHAKETSGGRIRNASYFINGWRELQPDYRTDPANGTPAAKPPAPVSTATKKLASVQSLKRGPQPPAGEEPPNTLRLEIS